MKNLHFPRFSLHLWGFLAVLVLTASAHAQLTDGERSMRGIKRAILVLDVPHIAETRLSTDAKSIRAHIVAKMQASGLTWMTTKRGDTEAGNPAVHITLTCPDSKGAQIGFIWVSTNLVQDVKTTRNPDTTLQSPTWSREGFLYFVSGTHKSSRRDEFYRVLDSQLDEFIQSYGRANAQE